MRSLLVCVAYFFIVGFVKTASAAEIEVLSFDANNISSMQISLDNIIESHLNFMTPYYTTEDILIRNPSITQRHNFQFQRLKEGKRHLIVALADNNIAAFSWVSNPVENIIFINQSNAASVLHHLKCLAKTLELFPKASKIELSILKVRAQDIEILRKMGATENKEPSHYDDDPTASREQELFFEIPTALARQALLQLSQQFGS